MATGGTGTTSSPQAIPPASHRGAPAPSNATSAAVSPPSKKELASWWKKFRKTTEKTDEKVDVAPGIFGVPLAESIRYANVAISLTNDQGESFIYGYVPIVVAKCGVFLKEKATDVEGIFRLSGSAKRIKDLQTIFNSPDRYGKGLDWTGYTVHDAANILRRYLNQLPEPIVPLEFYERFRDPLRPYQTRSTNDSEAVNMDLGLDEHAVAVSSYQKLITELPPLNRQLLLYILDLLAVFASKSDLNRMTANNLAAIFQPGIISHPQHDMAPMEYRLSQEVLIFLIENQDNFLIGMTGTAVDEKTQKDVESGAPSIRSPNPHIGRSASNASAGADSLRKHGTRRNLSTSSHASRERGSPGVSNPGTPLAATPLTAGSSGSGIGRSNTVPSRRSPAIAPRRFQRTADTSDSPSPNTGSDPAVQESSGAVQGASQNGTTTGPAGSELVGILPESDLPTNNPVSHPSLQTSGIEQSAVNSQLSPSTSLGTDQAGRSQEASRDRKVPGFFSKSPRFGPSDAQGRQPKKLQKKQRIPGSANDSAQSSQTSLQGEEAGSPQTPLLSPELNSLTLNDPMSTTRSGSTNLAATPKQDTGVLAQNAATPGSHDKQVNSSGLKPPKSPDPSLHSRSSMTDHSEFETLEDPATKTEKTEKRRHRWRLSSSARKAEEYPLAPPPPIGQHQNARGSNSSVGSSGRPRKSLTGEFRQIQQTGNAETTGQAGLLGSSHLESSEAARDINVESEKKGILGKLKAKMSQTREERREREAEKERAKSPPRSGTDPNVSRGSLAAIAQERLDPRGRSFDRPREESQSTAVQKSTSEVQANNNADPAQ